MTGSAITKEDYANNPQAVLEVLEFYTDQTKRNEAEYGEPSLVPSTLPIIPTDSEGDRWANLMPRQQPPTPSARPDRPQRPERPARPDEPRPTMAERSQSSDNLPVTQRMSSLGLYDQQQPSGSRPNLSPRPPNARPDYAPPSPTVSVMLLLPVADCIM